MTDESNGESTFEFVEEKVYMSISGDAGKKDSISSLACSTSLLISPACVSTFSGNLLSNIAPPLGLLNFATQPSELPIAKTSNVENSSDTVRKKLSTTSRIQTKPLVEEMMEGIAGEKSINISQPDQGPGSAGASSLFSWVKETVANSNVLSKVAEKAKSSVNSMITTLDPQMREFIYSGGDVSIIVASNEEIRISPIREAFQNVFGKATVTGVAVESAVVAEQPVGYAAGITGAEKRVTAARQCPNVPNDIPIVAVENFLLEVGVDKWYDLGVIILNDPKNGINLQTFTQMTPIPSQLVTVARESTSHEYPLKWSGFAVTISSLMAANLQVSCNEWHHALTGVSGRDIVLLATQSLAGIYKNTLSPV